VDDFGATRASRPENPADPSASRYGAYGTPEATPVTGADIFDLQIIATMLASSIQRIYTFNARDFLKFSELAVVTP